MSFKGIIKGLHHVTATVNDAQEDFDFYTKVLGLRLVKETVNFDNEKVYHFYYANKNGAPSTVFTTFPYKGQGVSEGVIGTGQATHSAFSIPKGSISFWKNRLTQHNIDFQETTLFGRGVLDFKDPSGLLIHLAEFENDNREILWTTDDISSSEAIRGVAYVTLLVVDAKETGEFLELFGYDVTGEENGIVQFETEAKGAGNIVLLQQAKDQPRGENGLGTVHHVAHRVEKLDDNYAIKKFMEEEKGLKVTEIRDRKYFKSIYFRIPGGVLFEVATVDPGFTVDEDLDALGEALKLPDWQEPNRNRIEANLLPYNK